MSITKKTVVKFNTDGMAGVIDYHFFEQRDLDEKGKLKTKELDSKKRRNIIDKIIEKTGEEGILEESYSSNPENLSSYYKITASFEKRIKLPEGLVSEV